jgi:hypothetical protein
MTVALFAAGFFQLATGLIMAFAPGAFYDHWAGFGAQNDHYIRDVATLEIALGAGLLWSAVRPAWRVPLLAVATLQSALHTVSHIVDLDELRSRWQGPVNLALVAGGTVLFLVLWRVLSQDGSTQPPPARRR